MVRFWLNFNVVINTKVDSKNYSMDNLTEFPSLDQLNRKKANKFPLF